MFYCRNDSDMYSDISEATIDFDDIASHNSLDLGTEFPNLEMEDLMEGVEDVIGSPLTNSQKRKRRHREVDLLDVLPFREGPISSRTRSKTRAPSSSDLMDVGPSSTQVRY